MYCDTDYRFKSRSTCLSHLYFHLDSFLHINALTNIPQEKKSIMTMMKHQRIRASYSCSYRLLCLARVALILALLTFVQVTNAAAVSATSSISSTSTSTSTRKRTSATMNGIKSSAASALAAGCSKTLLAPFDTINTMQTMRTVGWSAHGVIPGNINLTRQRPKGGTSMIFSLY